MTERTTGCCFLSVSLKDYIGILKTADCAAVLFYLIDKS